jgi:hypothetical protein
MSVSGMEFVRSLGYDRLKGRSRDRTVYLLMVVKFSNLISNKKALLLSLPVAF